jgi:cellulose synthase (UDP-forming)
MVKELTSGCTSKTPTPNLVGGVDVASSAREGPLGSRTADLPDATPSKSYLKPLMSPGERRAYGALSVIWLGTVVFFWWWWLQPQHDADPLRFFINTGLIFWATVIPGYFVVVFWRCRVVDRTEPPLPGWRVAMVVTKAPSEPFSVVRVTLESMLRQDYPHDTWLADEDPSAETLSWCAAHGVQVSTRKGVEAYHQPSWPRRTRCKEGNLAYFYDHFGYDNYDIVAQLDADHVPAEFYLTEIVRPFNDPKVGYVSAPSICDSNADASWSARGRLYVEGALHGALQAGYNGRLAPLCIGSHYAVRTKALREIGGIGPELAEDHSTTLIMNAHGWRGVHALDAIAHGEGPPTFAALATQEFQWSRSLAVILLRYTNTYFGGLSPVLKAQFLLSQLWYPLFSFYMACSVAVPVIALLTQRNWVAITYLDFLVHGGLVTMSIIALMLWVKSRGWFRPQHAKVMSWEGAVFTFARWPWSLLGLAAGAFAAVTGRGLDFRVTPKGGAAASAVPVSVVIPYITLSAASALAAALTSEPGSAGGFYAFALLNALIYLVIAVLILGMDDHAGHFLKGLAKANATLKVAVLTAASLFLFTGQARLAPGIDALVGPTAGMADTVTLPNAEAWLARRLPAALGDHPLKVAATEKPTLSIGVYDPKRKFASSPALALEHVFVSWVDPNTAALLEDAVSYAKARGRWLMVTVEPYPRREASRATLLQDVVAGRYDEEIDKFCGQISRAGIGVFVRWGHEMELSSGRYPWQVSDGASYSNAYRHFVERCRETTGSARDVYYVWSPAGDPALKKYYPGDGYVDWIGLSLYDCPVCNTVAPGSLRSFHAIAAEKYALVRGYQKPLMIAEMGVAGTAERQAEWVSEAMADTCSFPLLHMVVYFDAPDHPGVWGPGAPPDWRMEPLMLERATHTRMRSCKM